MTLGEINDEVVVCQKIKSNRAKEQIASNYNLALLIVSFLGASFNGDTIPDFNELYPEMEDTALTEVEIEERNNEYLKAQMIEFMLNHNKQRKQDDG